MAQMSPYSKLGQKNQDKSGTLPARVHIDKDTTRANTAKRKPTPKMIEGAAYEDRKFRVLFVCTGNAYRSPICEGLLKKLRPDLEVDSAGSRIACRIT
jgi:hypothetical protein